MVGSGGLEVLIGAFFGGLYNPISGDKVRVLVCCCCL